MHELKGRIQDRIASSLTTSPSAIILNWGPWGGGKTHAARYFSQEHIVSTLGQQYGVPAPLSIVLSLPRSSRAIVRDVYIKILRSIGLSRISEALEEVARTLGREFNSTVRNLARDEDLARAVILLAKKEREQPDPQDIFADEGERVIEPLQRLLYLTASKTDLNELGLVRPIEATDAMEVLALILNLLVYSEGDGTPPFSEVIIWFDEFEDVLTLPGKEQSALSNMLRDMTDLIPQNLTMFINFTFRSGGKLEDIGAYLGPAVYSRIRSYIELESLTPNSAKEYIVELMNSGKYRPQQLLSECALNDTFFPFTEKALDRLIHMVGPNATPRYLNEACTLVVERALSENAVSPPENKIGEDFVLRLEPELSAVGAKGRGLL